MGTLRNLSVLYVDEMKGKAWKKREAAYLGTV